MSTRSIELPENKLFRGTALSTYTKAFLVLEEMRDAHPSCRDDELLMKMICHLLETNDALAGDLAQIAERLAPENQLRECDAQGGA